MYLILHFLNFRIFVFCLAAALSGIGGALFTLQVGFMSPSFVGIVPSIEMVIYAAVGGRMSLVGDAMAHAVLPGAAAGFLLAGLSLPAMSLGGFVAARLQISLGAPMVLAWVWLLPIPLSQ